jgi:hypothetical protein
MPLHRRLHGIRKPHHKKASHTNRITHSTSATARVPSASERTGLGRDNSPPSGLRRNRTGLIYHRGRRCRRQQHPSSRTLSRHTLRASGPLSQQRHRQRCARDQCLSRRAERPAIAAGSHPRVRHGAQDARARRQAAGTQSFCAVCCTICERARDSSGRMRFREISDDWMRSGCAWPLMRQ